MSRPSPPPRFQFSLRWLILGVTIVAFVLGLASFAAEIFVAVLLVPLVWCVLPTILLMCVLYGRGDLRTFSVGALIPVAFMWVRAPGWERSLSTHLSFGLWVLLEGAICGAVAVVMRRLLDRYGPTEGK